MCMYTICHNLMRPLCYSGRQLSGCSSGRRMTWPCSTWPTKSIMTRMVKPADFQVLLLKAYGIVNCIILCSLLSAVGRYDRWKDRSFFCHSWQGEKFPKVSGRRGIKEPTPLAQELIFAYIFSRGDNTHASLPTPTFNTNYSHLTKNERNCKLN